ncbi:MaoC family dehydratase [Pontibacillus litoralis]|uniref:Enoyl-CoA hydratase n=1 Tax=Pontibacillus litoralis JSM 072002 TaxID=1385512 RepID=A0A0A5GDB1_9BACI|nr:MaoC/PaaZ C-terminal domain-containing protein [Pontibacillus litoralis]KGX89090.1 enoyl-CoA hydratase [Pontibacillus litoralis JSM 072002]
MIGKKRKLGSKLKELKVGQSYSADLTIADKELLLFLGLTDDANPLYIQHDYASQTPFKQPLVPPVMLIGFINSAISMYLPGPGCHIVEQQVTYPHPVYHYAVLSLYLEVTDINEEDHLITVMVKVEDEEGRIVVDGKMKVCPAYELESMNAKSLENFY